MDVLGFELFLGACEDLEFAGGKFDLGDGAGEAEELLALLRGQDAEEFVFEGEEELERAEVALPRGAADELAVESFRGVHLGGDDVQSPGGAHGLLRMSVPRRAMLVAIMKAPS